MSNDLSEFLARFPASPPPPLLGLTILVVEDSRFASEAMRLLCLRSGARIRRADCLRSAHRHLQTYRPSVVVVDLGLPDGSGADLIAELAALPGRSAVVLGTSGDAAGEALALAAGADGFLAKPIESLAAFQRVILQSLPAQVPRTAPHIEAGDEIRPDPLALRDDLKRVADTLGDAPDGAAIDYITQFLAGVARSAHDSALESAARSLTQALQRGTGAAPRLATVNGLLRARLSSGAKF